MQIFIFISQALRDFDSLEDCPTGNVIFMNPCGIETVWKTVLPTGYVIFTSPYPLQRGTVLR
ncbi:MAG: hypothetical protein JW917_10760 [Ignavibacteria bacterium]|nr:hypothetical protein [Ignavibacteria bacterium]